MKEVQYFKATKNTHCFRKNQKVWIQHNFANHLWVYFKWHGNGKYVKGIADKFSNLVGDIKTIEVDDAFADRVHDDSKLRQKFESTQGR